MNKRYTECQREDGDCTICSLSNNNRDCRNNPVNRLAYLRTCAGLTQQALSASSGVNIRQIQRVESGESEAGNLTLRNAVAIADALGADVRDLYK